MIQRIPAARKLMNSSSRLKLRLAQSSDFNELIQQVVASFMFA
jgi:hypothetical protein